MAKPSSSSRPKTTSTRRPSTRRATRRALCVGINVFKNYPAATLQGCVNDARDMAALLKDHFGFIDADITVLTDRWATKAAIMARLRAMVDEAKAGQVNYLVFSLSSHGTQIPDASGDERADHADEAFCPYDLAAKGDRWDPDRIITDDELNALFSELPPRVLLEAYFDTCHSGTGLKDPFARYWPPPSEASLAASSAASPAAPPKLRGVAKALAPTPTAKRRRVLWAGCKADQTSADAVFDGRPNGAFTYFYIQTVRAGQDKLTRAQVRDRVRAALKRHGFTQTPQLETDATHRGRLVRPPRAVAPRIVG